MDESLAFASIGELGNMLRRRDVAHLPRIVHVGHLPRRDIRGDRDGAMAAAGKIGKCCGILAGQLGKIAA
mgnify:CR=1 FL=1